MFFEFKDNDIFRQTIVAFPSYNFFYFKDDNDQYKIILNNFHTESGKSLSISSYNLNEINVDRTGSQIIFPYIDKTSNGYRLSNIDESTFNALLYGSSMIGTYLTFPSMYIDFITSTEHSIYKVSRNIWNSYKKLSADFDFSNFPSGAAVHLFPREFYGSGIKKGSVIATIEKRRSDALTDHEYNVYDKLVAQDIYEDGILRIVQDSFTGSNVTSLTGTKVGYVLYDHGLVIFKSASAIFYNKLTDTSDLLETDLIWPSSSYGTAEDRTYFNWRYFGDPASVSVTGSNLFCSLKFQGTNNIQNITMFCNLPKVKLNNSTNPTFINYSQSIYLTQSTTKTFVENDKLEIKNIVSSTYNVEEPFEKQTIISTVYILDENKEVIGVAKLANPIVKRENTDRTIKIGFDL